MNINLTSPITEKTSYGIAATNIIKALLKRGNDVTVFPIGEPSAVSEDVEILKTVLYQNKGYIYDADAPSIRLYHNFDLAQHPGNGSRIGFSIWELDDFSDIEHRQMNSMNSLACCSDWAKRILQEEFPDKPVFVYPLGVDRDIFHEDAHPNMLNYGSTTFLNIGKWEVRKGHDVLIKAFNAAFNVDDDVKLVMLPHNYFIDRPGCRNNNDWRELYENSKLGGKIVFIDRLGTPSDVAGLIAACDCMVTPARAEGWNLGNLEALSTGKHLITTNYSGHTEYATKENSLLIDIDETEIANDGFWFRGDVGNWAKFGDNQFDQLVTHMRYIHTLKQVGALPRNDAGIETAKNFTWDNTATQIEKSL